MKVLTLDEAEKVLRYFDEAAEVASESLCLRAHCGSVIVKDSEIIARGFNAPPQNNEEYRTCLTEYEIPAGFRHDRTCCMHAEQRAVADAVAHGKDMEGARIYFIALEKDGSKIFATDVKCTICSRAVLDAGITEFALYCAEGVRIYDTVEFNALSYEYKTPRRA